MQVGGGFVLNCLGEADADVTMKHFLKRFAAGQDRFEVRVAVTAYRIMCRVVTSAFALSHQLFERALAASTSAPLGFRFVSGKRGECLLGTFD
jgi:hypothetical protein